VNAAEEIVAPGEMCRAMALAQPRWPHQCAQAPFRPPSHLLDLGNISPTDCFGALPKINALDISA
jgi:hypothetical protein